MNTTKSKIISIIIGIAAIASVAVAAVYNSLNITGKGGKPATAEWIPTTADWGYVEVGTSTDKTFRLKNSGKTQLVGNITLGVGCSPVFTIVSGGGTYSLAPGVSRDVVIRFAPTDTTATYNCVVSSGP